MVNNENEIEIINLQNKLNKLREKLYTIREKLYIKGRLNSSVVVQYIDTLEEQNMLQEKLMKKQKQEENKKLFISNANMTEKQKEEFMNNVANTNITINSEENADVSEIEEEIEIDGYNKPGHYHKNSIDVIGFLKQFFPEEKESNYSVVEGFYIGNIIKYICRYKEKEGLYDLEKAQDYVNRLIDHEKQIKGGIVTWGSNSK